MTERTSYSSDGPECPACGFTFTPDEGHYYDEHAYTEDTCPECNCKFEVSVHHSVSWECEIKSTDGEHVDTKEG